MTRDRGRVLLINTRPTRTGTRPEADPRLDAYFNALEGRGPKYGDTRTEPNNGLLVLGGCLRARGWDPVYLDVGAMEYGLFLREGRFFSHEELDALIADAARGCAAALFSVIVVGADDALRSIDVLKARRPDLAILLGGTFPSLCPDYCLARCRGLDALVMGEGEVAVPRLLDALVHGEADALDGLKGLALRRPDGSVELRPGFNLVDLDALGPLALPDWSLLDPALGPHVYRVMTTRGCGFKCSYCVPSHMCGHHVRRHDAGVVLDAIRRVKHEHGASNYVIGDLTFFYDQEFSRDILRAVARENIGLPFWCQTHLSRVNDENLRLLAEAGCRQLAVGVESVNPSILETINKGIRPDEIVDTLVRIKAHGIETQAYFIVGIPGDTRETMDLNRAFMEHGVRNGYIDRTHIGVYVPYPGPTAHKALDLTDDPFMHYTQGIFRDMPARAVFSTPQVDAAEATERLRDTLAAVGRAIAETGPVRRGGAELDAQALSLGVDALHLAQRLRSRGAALGKPVLFNLVQAVAPAGQSFVSDNIQEEEPYVLGSAEVRTTAEAEQVLAAMRGTVDAVLLDCDVKVPASRELVRAAQALLEGTPVLPYSDVQCWAKCLARLVHDRLGGGVPEARVLVAPDNLVARRTALFLEDFGLEVLLGGTDEAAAMDAVVRVDLEPSPDAAESVRALRPGGVFVLGAVGAADQELLRAANAVAGAVYRPDMRKFILSEVVLGLEFARFMKGAVGARVVQGLELVSGGVVAREGGVVVDDVSAPSRIIGIADGRGGLVSRRAMDSGHVRLLNQARKLTG